MVSNILSRSDLSNTLRSQYALIHSIGEMGSRRSFSLVKHRRVPSAQAASLGFAKDEAAPQHYLIPHMAANFEASMLLGTVQVLTAEAAQQLE